MIARRTANTTSDLNMHLCSTGSHDGEDLQRCLCVYLSRTGTPEGDLNATKSSVRGVPSCGPPGAYKGDGIGGRISCGGSAQVAPVSPLNSSTPNTLLERHITLIKPDAAKHLHLDMQSRAEPGSRWSGPFCQERSKPTMSSSARAMEPHPAAFSLRKRARGLQLQNC